MKRTTDIAFSTCPICGRRPYVKTFNINYGTVYCKGGILNRHPIIQVHTGYCNPSKIIRELSNGWNSSHCQQLNSLPINVSIEELNK